MPKVGEVWRTRVGPYHVRVIADDAIGDHPIVGLVRIGPNDVAWGFTKEGLSRDAWDNGFDLVEQVGEAASQANIAQDQWDKHLKAVSQ